MSRKSPEKPTKPESAADARDRRRAEALRANLKRRKAAGLTAGQAQAADTSGKSPPGED